MRQNPRICLSVRTVLIMLALIPSKLAWSQELTPVLSSTGKEFRIDGNVVQQNVSGTYFSDWVANNTGNTSTGWKRTLFDSSGNVKSFVNSGNNYTFHIQDAYTGSDNVFDGGHKIFGNPSTYGWKLGSASAKTDLHNMAAHFTRSTAGDFWAIFASDRQSSNGSSYVDFELSQAGITKTGTTSGSFIGVGPNCGRTVGDILITVAYSGGGRIDSLYFYQWSESTLNSSCSSNGKSYSWEGFSPTWDDDGNSQTPQVSSGFGYCNVGTTSVPYGAFGSNVYSTNTNQFAEVAINLSSVIQYILENSTSNPCVGISFQTLFVKTKSSTSFAANMSDFVDPIAIDLNINTSKISGSEYCNNTINGVISINDPNGTYTNGAFEAKTLDGLSTVSGITFGTIGANTPIYISKNVGAGIYKVIYSYTARTGCNKTAETTITVYQTPEISPISDKTFCNNEKSDIVFGDTSTIYEWTNSNTAIGMAASGTRSILNNTFTNTTNAPITATISVTAKNTNCTGNTVTFTITVNPTPIINPISNQSLCNGVTTTEVTFGTNVSAATTYSWTNSNNSVGLSASGNGNSIASFTAANSSSTTPSVATITVNASSLNCDANPLSFTITVNPTPEVSFIDTIADRCFQNGNFKLLGATPAGGIYFGDYVYTSGSDYMFDVINNGQGAATVKYEFSNTYGCRNIATDNFKVNQCGNTYCAVSQGFWGNQGGKFCYYDGSNWSKLNTARLMSKLLTGNGITIGLTGTCSNKFRSFKIVNNDSNRVIAVLPAGGPSSKLVATNCSSNDPATLVSYFNGNTNTSVSPEISIRQNDGRFKNTLLGQMITMKLNVLYNPSLGNLSIENNFLNTQRSQDCNTGKNIGVEGTWQSSTMPTVVRNYFVGGKYTVNQLLAISDSLIGGANLQRNVTKPTLNDVNTALSNLVAAFDGCRILISQTSSSLSSSLELNSDEIVNTNPLFDVEAYPNPLDHSTMISFILPAASNVRLKIYNGNGVEVSSLIDGMVDAGQNAINWLATDFPDGIYFYRIEVTASDNGEVFSKSGKLLINR